MSFSRFRIRVVVPSKSAGGDGRQGRAHSFPPRRGPPCEPGPCLLGFSFENRDILFSDWAHYMNYRSHWSENSLFTYSSLTYYFVCLNSNNVEQLYLTQICANHALILSKFPPGITGIRFVSQKSRLVDKAAEAEEQVLRPRYAFSAVIIAL